MVFPALTLPLPSRTEKQTGTITSTPVSLLCQDKTVKEAIFKGSRKRHQGLVIFLELAEAGGTLGSSSLLTLTQQEQLREPRVSFRAPAGKLAGS